MLDQLAAAFARHDYPTAAALLNQLQQQSPDSPWIKLYGARLREATGKLSAAEELYRQVLQETSHPKVMTQARQGLQRVAAQQEAERQQVIAATADADQPGLGCLVLEAVPSEQRQTAAQHFARIMHLDAYTARLLLPNRGWRLYRVGAVGELQFYGQALQQAGIPAFWSSLAALQAIRVFRVCYLEAVSPQVTVICQNESGQLGSLTFAWSEISRRVEGRLPIFEDVVDVDSRHQLMRKEQTQDYAQVLDLHLPQRRCILRLGDWSYQFQQGVIFDAGQDGDLPLHHSSNRIRWNQLLGFLDDCLAEVPVWAEFPPFAETAFDHLAGLKTLDSHIDLFRKAPSDWDPAFQLYSGLVFDQFLQLRAAGSFQP
ncbi:MAG: tetratricopeptide repeat protein [Synechococcales cyanobacterium M58_A2018_015]|nr:tetratricopeptide repeat protein [Synechococcales cyanobacterium M58_A2018_015]